ncbi:hypothetical protein ACFIQG_13495 [Comamonas odontotermitis]|uniref:hypothetical protein n=1 Tax=Comamonas odontotermitis TaxID=379895 RepID=UPI00366F0186
MRIDQQLNVASLAINSRQHFFLSAWFNLVHQHSLDAYRVRVMNPVNILRELSRMFDPPANDNDRKVVALEALEILHTHPVIVSNASKHLGMPDAIAFIKEAVETKEGGFKKNMLLLRSFMREVESALHDHFLADCFTWMEATLQSVPDGENQEQREQSYANIERVCRDIVSVAHDLGFSLESLFHLYRLFLPKEQPAAGAQRAKSASPDSSASIGNNQLAAAAAMAATEDADMTATAPSAEPYDFAKRFERLRSEILAAPKEHQVIFTVSGAPKSSEVCCGNFGAVVISQNVPVFPPSIFFKTFFSEAPRRLFASATVKSRDGRSAGLQAYGNIGQILDLMRFEYDTPDIKADTRFLLKDGGGYRLLTLPQLVPNPEADPPTKTLEEFTAHLIDLAARDSSQTETRDRIFSAFRLYRQGTGANMFDNKLVNWWTGLEYLTSGGKTGGDIGETVKNALAPTLALTYLPKHLTAFRSALAMLNIEAEVEGVKLKIKQCSNAQLYALLKDPHQSAVILDSCESQPYLWKHLTAFTKEIKTPANTAKLITTHDRRIRWQIERIYRTRCDIVHAGRQVITASLLCSNLEFYLRMTLKSMLRGFSTVATLMGPAEFFERQRHQFNQVLQQLQPEKNGTPDDTLLIASLD